MTLCCHRVERKRYCSCSRGCSDDIGVQEKNEWICVCTFSCICLSYHGQPIHRRTRQLHVIQVDFTVVTWQHINHASIINKLTTILHTAYAGSIAHFWAKILAQSSSDTSVCFLSSGWKLTQILRPPFALKSAKLQRAINTEWGLPKASLYSPST